ncbi:MAG: ribulose-phosphate 3-epimerase [Clostridia bacterium]
MIFSPSLACGDYLRMGDNIKQLIDGDIELFHIDIMDGHYVPNLCLNLDFLRAIKREYPESKFDVHLMVDDPISYIEPLAEIGVDYITFHLSSTNFAHRVISTIKKYGIKAGVAINALEPFCLLEPVLDLVDMVLVMSIEPGFSGQQFISAAYDRIEKLAKIKLERELHFIINVDGGINPENGKQCAKLGADALVLGYFAVFNQADDITAACKRFARQIT